MKAEQRRTLGTILIWLGVLGGWWLRNSANRMEGLEAVQSPQGRRRKLASRILIYLRVLAWVPYLYLDRILGLDVEIAPFLAAHLTGVLSGVALRLSVEWER